MLHCLCLLELALQKEVVFMDLLRESQATMLVSPLEQLLQGVNPQSRRADDIVIIARYGAPPSNFPAPCHPLPVLHSGAVCPSQVPVPQHLQSGGRLPQCQDPASHCPLPQHPGTAGGRLHARPGEVDPCCPLLSNLWYYGLIKGFGVRLPL